MSQSQRVGVWIDYENARHSAAGHFASRGPGIGAARASESGHFWPLALARRLVARPVAVTSARHGSAQPSWRELVRVDAFMGMPERTQRPALAWYVERMTRAWSRQGVNVTLLPTWQTTAGLETEKGIDVSLALSVQEAALRREVDVVILVSSDNDLLPVVYELHPRRSYLPGIELAAWRGPAGGEAMRAPVGVLTHLLDSADYADVATNLVRDFGRPSSLTLRDARQPTVVTLADRLADVGLAVKVGPLRPIPSDRAPDSALWPSVPAEVRRVRFGSDGLIPEERPAPIVVVFSTTGAVGAPTAIAQVDPLAPALPGPGLPWWRRVIHAVLGRGRRPPRPAVTPTEPSPPPAADKLNATHVGSAGHRHAVLTGQHAGTSPADALIDVGA